MTKAVKAKKIKKVKDSKCGCMCKCEPIPPWSETREEPDAQWCPEIPVKGPIVPLNLPLYSSSEDPEPQYVPDVIIRPACDRRVSKHQSHHNHGKQWEKLNKEHNMYGGCPFLRSHWQDNILLYVYGTNPFSDTVNSGGPHFQ
jgi:hypothetical protein